MIINSTSWNRTIVLLNSKAQTCLYCVETLNPNGSAWKKLNQMHSIYLIVLNFMYT